MALRGTLRPCTSGHVLEPKTYKKQYTCDGCKEQGYGPRYRCEPCDYDLHEGCMLMSNTTSHPFFGNHNFLFLERLPRDLERRRCDACAREVFGFVYHCYEEGWDLHPCCFGLHTTLYAEGIEFQLQKEVQSKCMRCNKKNLKGSAAGVRGWSYESKCKKHQIHVYCVLESVLDVLKCQETSEGEGVLLRLHKGGNKERHSKVGRMLVRILKIVANVLLGDPTAAVASLLSELVLT